MEVANLRVLFLAIITFFQLSAFEFDKSVKEPSDDPLWTSHHDIPYYLIPAVGVLALVEGTSSRIGNTSLKAVDSFIFSQTVTELLKRTTNRKRPRYTDSPDEWFADYDDRSFPSGHVSSVTAVVTPYILEYRHDYPAVYLLSLLPIHQMVGRVKAKAHWQSDVVVGALVGFLSGYYAHSRDYPLTLYFDSDKIFAGIRYRF
jgi:undecaprenyl-diphosphatase